MSFPTINVECASMTSYTMNSLLSSLPDDYWAISQEPWGDIVPPSENTGPMEIGWSSCSTPESDALENWVAPDIRLRKNIWENFPVALIPLANKDSTVRYAIVWHRVNLQEWRNTKTSSYAEWLDYEDFCHIRLMQTLYLNSHRYTVEDAEHSNQICVIAMVHSGDSSAESRPNTPPLTESVVPVAPTAKDTGSKLPILKSFRDISQNFPVDWIQEGRTLHIKFNSRKLKELCESPALVRDRLFQALKMSDVFTFSVAPAGKMNILCTATY